MGSRQNEFSRFTQEAALERQQHLCASCGTKIDQLGLAGAATHEYGESAQAHHMRPIRAGGTSHVSNCIVLCQACHYSAHEGGNYRHGTVIGAERDYPYYRGAAS
jgi:5-methylcytosine-specific restriction endonuclease McrA